MNDELVPVARVEPGWELYHEGEWVLIDMEVKTDSHKRFYADDELLAVVEKDERVRARQRE
jgi:hypothetical protein